MSDSTRLTGPLVAEIDLPAHIDRALWCRRLSALHAGGVSVFSIVCHGLLDTVADLLAMEGIDLALTLSKDDWPPTPAWRRLAPCTIRIPVDTARLPDTRLRERVALLHDIGFAVVLLGHLPPSEVRQAWIDWVPNTSVAALNIEDGAWNTPESYREFLITVAEFSRRCVVPIISDLVLMQRYFPGTQNIASMCPAGRLALFVSTRGMVSPCRNSRLCVGSLDTQDLAEIWNSDALKTWTQVPEECVRCAIEECRGGCLARRSSTGRDMLCPGPV
ncbi:SPASM domain-containing protein [Thermodesulfobacteriota bacterium]